MPCMSARPDRFSNLQNPPCAPTAAYLKESSHPALLEVPERAALEPEQEPERMRRAPAQVLLEREPELVRVLLQQAQPEQEPKWVRTWQEISSPGIARAAQASDYLLLLLERGRRPGSQALPLRLKSPCWLAAPQVVNKIQPGKNQEPEPSELFEFVRSCLHLSK